MDITEQPVFLMQVLVNLVPPATYFLILGLVNSSARPILVSGRQDFAALMLVFLPLMVWPLPFLLGLLVGLGWWSWLIGAAGLLLAAAGLTRLLPARWQSWVIYNISEPQARSILDAVLKELGLTGWRDDVTGALIIPSAHLRIGLSSLPLLRNVTLHVEPTDEPIDLDRVSQIVTRFRDRLGTVSLLPSTGGACLLMTGVVMLVLPLFMMSRHVGVIVDMVTRWLFA